MKVIVDAQLPLRLSDFLKLKGIDSIHTIELLAKNKTSDQVIIEICENENRVIITKDSDFYESKLIKNKPLKLILVNTGNINNDNLIDLFKKNLDKIVELIEVSDIVELGIGSITSK